MEGGESDAAVLQRAGTDSGLDKTIGHRLQIVVDGDIHILYSAGDQCRLDLGIGVVLVNIGTDGLP